MNGCNSEIESFESNNKIINTSNNNNNKINIEIEENNIKIINKKLKRSKTSKKINKNKNKNDETDCNLKNNKIINLNIEFKSNPNNIKYLKDLIEDSYTITYSDNSFIVFISYNNILYLIYSNKKNSIVCFNIKDNKKVNEIKKAHKDKITNFRHYLDENNERDLLLSISSKNNNLKVWYFQNFECIYNFEKINKNGYLNSACFLNDNNEIYILTSHYRFSSNKTEFIKIFDLKGNKIKEFDESNEQTVFVDIFYDKKLNKKYILTGNYKYIKSFYFEENSLYQIYNDNDYNYHDSVIINNNEKIIKMIESSGDGNIRIWDFHEAKLISKIRVNKSGIYGICLWNKDYLFAGSKKTIKLININKKEVEKSLRGHSNEIVTIKKIIHPIYGECILSQERDNYNIKIWKTEK